MNEHARKELISLPASIGETRMVFGLIALAGTVPLTVTSVLSVQNTAQNQAENNKSSSTPSYKSAKAHISCRATTRTPADRKALFTNSKIVLRNGGLFVQLEEYQGKQNHPFTGYFLPYPDEEWEGLVSTVGDTRQLNWIYLDTSSTNKDIKSTSTTNGTSDSRSESRSLSPFQIRHGLRIKAEENGITGPWDTKRFKESGEIRFTLEGWEGFVAVETEEEGLWSLCFDRKDDGLKGRVKEGTRVVEVELVREEIEEE